DAVNETWMCDAGRLSYKRIGAEDRLGATEVRGADGIVRGVSVDEGVAEAVRRLRVVVERNGGGAIGAIASPHATNEDLFVLRRLLEALGSSQVGYAVRRGPADDLLIRAEKAANAEGCRALGFGEAGPLLERARGGAVDAMIVLGSDALVEPGLLDVLRGLDTVLYVDTHHSPVETVAHVIFPARHAAEKHGTLTNHAGRVQRVAPAVEPPFEAFAEGALLWRLGQALG